MSKNYIHYGHNKFEAEKFVAIKNRKAFNKPYGGLWASAVDAEYGWKEWNDDEDFVKCDNDNSFVFSLTPEARIFVIDNVEKVRDIPKIELESIFGKDIPAFVRECLSSQVGYDFERLAKDYDAIEFLLSKDRRLYDAMYGWDCDSLLVLNKECIVPENTNTKNEEENRMENVNKLYGIWHCYDVDGGIGDAIPQEDLVAICEDEALANEYAAKHSNPHVYAKPYAELYEHELVVRPMDNIIVVTRENVNVSPFSKNKV